MTRSSRHRSSRGPLARLLAVGTAAALALTLAACGSDSDGDTDTAGATDTDETTPGADPGPLTVYTGQHEDTVLALTDAFTAETGIRIVVRAGDDAELANQLLEEGSGTPADLFLTEEPGPIGLVDSAGLLAAVDPDTLVGLDQRLVPSSGNWMPYAARSRVIFYNPDLIAEDDLPYSIMDLVEPEWAGRFAYAPSGAFTSTVSYLIGTIGKDATLEWLKGIKANGINEQKNGKVRDSVEAGQHEFGLSNHYYWYFLARDKGGAENLTSRVHYFDHPDAGGLLLASGAGILAASEHQQAAQQFLAWLASADGGQALIAQGESAQFPVATGVDSQAGLPSLSDLSIPDVADPSVFADTSEAQQLIIDAGIV